VSSVADQDARERIRDALDESLCIEAGAGTGKTTALVDRVVNVLRTGRATVDQIAVITFTDAAAAELSSRIRESLERAFAAEADGPTRENIRRALAGLYRAHVETIHAFATTLLRERPVEAGLDPAFEVAQGLAAQLAFDAAYSDFQTGLLDGSVPEVAVALSRGFGVAEIRTLTAVIDENRALLPLQLVAPVAADVDGFVALYRSRADEIRTLLAPAARDDGASTQMETIVDVAGKLAEAASDPDWRDRAVLAAPWLSMVAGAQKHWDDIAGCRRTKEIFVELRKATEAIQEAMRSEAICRLIPHVERFVARREGERRREGSADFDDLLNWARALLLTSPEAREYFRRRFPVLLVDEFQDTDPVQAEIAILIASDEEPLPGEVLGLEPRPGGLTVVGDPKQSIYRFRGADISVYDAVREGALKGDPPQLVQNFRSTTAVIKWVNEAFDRVLEKSEGVQPAYEALVPTGRGLADESRSIVVLRAAPADTADEARVLEGCLIAGAIRRAIDERWAVRDEATQIERPARFGDVAILFPTRTGLDDFEAALRSQGIPYRVQGGRGFFSRQEILDLSNMLAAIDDPADAVSLVATLRSSVFACTDEEIYLHVVRNRRLDFRAPTEGSPDSVAEAFAELLHLHRLRTRTSLARLVREAVQRTRLIEVALTGWDGRQAAANVAKLVEQARAFSAGGGGGLRAFARWLTDQRGARDTEDAGVSEATDDAVRLITMHASKGLEFPIVALANLGASQSTRTEPVADREHHGLELGISANNHKFQTPGFKEAWKAEKVQLQAEELRLLYVAATRARDRLIIPVSHKGGLSAKLAALDPSLPRDGDPLETPADGRVLLDPALLPAPRDDEPPPPAAPSAVDVDRALAERTAWIAARDSARASAREELAVFPATRDEGDRSLSAVMIGADDEPLIVSEGPPAPIGDAMHRVLELIDLRDPREIEQRVAAVCALAGLAGHEEQLGELVRACLASPVVARLRAAARSWAEVPYTTRVADGYATGRIDVVFEEDGELVVIDWKSDAVAPSGIEAAGESHRGQGEAYTRALEASTGLIVREVVWVFPRAPGESSLRPLALRA
jgi:ATP-dependent helicase/nuclease subunit A